MKRRGGTALGNAAADAASVAAQEEAGKKRGDEEVRFSFESLRAARRTEPAWSATTGPIRLTSFKLLMSGFNSKKLAVSRRTSPPSVSESSPLYDFSSPDSDIATRPRGHDFNHFDQKNSSIFNSNLNITKNFNSRSSVGAFRETASMRRRFLFSLVHENSATNIFQRTISSALILLTIWLLCFSNPVLCNRLRHHSRRFYDEHPDGIFYGRRPSSESNAPPLPMFDLSQNDEVNVPWGRNAYLHCSVRNKSARIKLAWTRLRDGILLTVDNQSFADPTKYFVSYVDQENDYILVIKNTNLDDSGVYQCELSTQSPQRRLVTLTVTANEGEILGSRETSVGGLITLICRVKVIQPNRQLPAALIWYHNDSGIRFVDTGGRARKKASSKDEYHISETIEIIDAKPEDAGLYRCAPTPDTLGGKLLTMWVDVTEGAAVNRLSARNTPQKQEKFLDGRPSRSVAAKTGPFSVFAAFFVTTTIFVIK